MRNRYLVTYDVCNERRLRRVFKKMKGFGLHLQLSVFECELSARELAVMTSALDPLLNHALDQVLIADLGPADGRGGECVRSLGLAYRPRERKPVVV
jgi:CRISPR-associated protein Cas2